MNERIKELAEQAGFQYIKDERIGWAGNYNSSLPKFAELIVRECAQVSEDDISDGDACCTNTADRIARQIKKHFGVEERTTRSGMMARFEDWFEEIEITSPRCFRFWEELQTYLNDAKELKAVSAAPIEKWLRAAYEAGRKDGKTGN